MIEVCFYENTSFQNPIFTFALLCFVKTTVTKQNGKLQKKPKIPPKNFFRGLNHLDWTESLISGSFFSRRKSGRNVSSLLAGAVDRSASVTGTGEGSGSPCVSDLTFLLEEGGQGSSLPIKSGMPEAACHRDPESAFQTLLSGVCVSSYCRSLRLSSLTILLSAWAPLPAETSAWASDGHF